MKKLLIYITVFLAMVISVTYIDTALLGFTDQKLSEIGIGPLARVAHNVMWMLWGSMILALERWASSDQEFPQRRLKKSSDSSSSNSQL